MELGTTDVAAVLSAYLVVYDEKRVGLFSKLRTEIEMQFEEELVLGRRFVGAAPELGEYPLDLVLAVITKVIGSNRGFTARLIDFVIGVNS